MICLETTDEDLALPNPTVIHLQMSKQSISTYYYSHHKEKKNFSFIRPLTFSKNNTLIEVHKKVFKFFKFLWDEAQ